MPVEKYGHCKYPIPVRHTRKVPFEPRIRQPDGFGDRALELRRLDGELDRFILKASDYADLLVEAWSENIHRSVSIEGNPLSAQEVRRVVRESLRPAAGRAAPERADWPRQEIINHLAVHANPDEWEVTWTIAGIQGLHKFLLDGAPADTRPGQWRDFRGVILSDKGEEVCITAPPEHIEEEIASLLKWRNERAEVYFPVVAATVFFHEFESIHPFADGNGRTGRVLFHHYLQTQGLPNAHLCMIEPELMENLERYYHLLAWTDYRGEYTELVDFFTDSVLRSYQSAVRRLGRKDLLSKGLDETAKRLLTRAKQDKERWFTVGEAERWVDGRGHATVRRHLNALVEEGALESEGRTQGKRYRFRDPLRRVQALEAAASPSALQAARERMRASRLEIQSEMRVRPAGQGRPAGPATPA